MGKHTHEAAGLPELGFSAGPAPSDLDGALRLSDSLAVLLAPPDDHEQGLEVGAIESGTPSRDRRGVA